MKNKKIYKNELIKVLRIYEEELSKKFLNKPMTPALQEIMQAELDKIRCKYSARETNLVWQVPVKIETSGFGSFTLTPDLSDFFLVETPVVYKGWR